MLGACAQNMVTGEYWVDIDPGFGEAITFNPDLGGTPTETVQFDLPTDNIDPGMHTIGYRTMEATGKWSLTNLRLVYIAAAPSDAPIVRTVYFLNNDPGWAGGSDAGVDGASDVTEGTAASLSGAVAGINTLYFRSQDANGHWSLTNHVPLYIADSSNGVIEEVEYFWDVDPGFGMSNMDTVLANPAADWQGMVMAMVPSGLDTGDHALYMRSRDSRGRWSLTNLVGTINVDTTISTGVDEEVRLAGGDVAAVFPNPFAEVITVRTSDGTPLRVTLYDPQGKLVLDRFLNNGEPIDLSGHSSGAYTAFLWSKKDVIHRVTLIKQ